MHKNHSTDTPATESAQVLQSGSPHLKRRRSSSSSCDYFWDDLSQGDLEALDKLEAEFHHVSNNRSQPEKEENLSLIEQALRLGEAGHTTATNPPSIPSSGLDDALVRSAKPVGDVATRSIPMFTSALNAISSFPSASSVYSRSPSPELIPEQDYSSWFSPDGGSVLDVDKAIAVPLFQTAKSVAATPKTGNAVAAFIAPSEVALEKAKERMKAWREGDIQIAPSCPDFQPLVDSSLGSSQVSHIPLPVAFSQANAPAPASTEGLKEVRGKLQHRLKQFRSPLLTTQPKSSSDSSPLNPHRSAIASPTHMQFNFASSSLSTVGGASRMSANAARRGTPAKMKFVTPFKPGMGPGEPGRLALSTKGKGKERIAPTIARNVLEQTKADGNANVENDTGESSALCSIKCKRRTLSSSGLIPQAYNAEELEGFGINISELSQITPTLAAYYTFHTRSSAPTIVPESGQATEMLGPAAALLEMHQRGCRLATQAWVDNHWCLILWKLAGMVALDPSREAEEKRWCWGEVMRQLLYRYQRDLDSPQRSALRLITTQDAPASIYIVLCVSGITWSEGGCTDDGRPIEPHPELEVTDGWYRLRAQIDAALAKAVRKGVIRVGRKIAVVGATLSTERKEPLEVLEAYNSTKLILTGNSSHLAPWHAKLGFQKGFPPVCTMNKLTTDGGVVAVMDLLVLKVFPLAYIEFIQEDGKTRREGPRNEMEEAKVVEKWKAKREVEVSKLKLAADKVRLRLERWTERLERKAGDKFKPKDDDSPPDKIDDLYDELEEASDVGPIIARLSPSDAGWLAAHLRDKIIKDTERLDDEIENELTHTCPPRRVRDFRVLLVQDARTEKRPSHRRAKLTVWDALGLTVAEGGEGGAFREGQRFRVTNLLPAQQGAWMGRDPGAEIYLTTGKKSRWTRIL